MSVFESNKENIVNAATKTVAEISDQEVNHCIKIMSVALMRVLEDVGTFNSINVQRNDTIKIMQSVVASYAIVARLEHDDVHDRIQWMLNNIDNIAQKSTRLIVKHEHVMREIQNMVDSNWDKLIDKCISGAGRTRTQELGTATMMLIFMAFADHIEVAELGESRFNPIVDYYKSLSPNSD